ncbi:hypothetical protein PHLGIDRAFT_120546 [Phlebiopsis gigantea 11061_1 CR5-6]|uniref:Uncharacterized protein n=1 Tax=Phlebiopsis gigantea (strain 11061_1 CR5-6) TaxID=745531 RepID=A0A0C3RUE5_PHLG1|nr:hypothetical protein PHLGIDRAFT_120546 [Phlebiopsis gigantea 11061_1 CR5-6]
MRYNRLLETILLFAALPAGKPTVIRSVAPTCESNGLCFLQTPIVGTSSVIGIALPEKQDLNAPEMLISLQIGLPYGFSGVSLNENSTQALFISDFPARGQSVEAAEKKLSDPAFLETLSSADFVVQMSKPLPNNTFAPGFGANITLAPDIFFVNTSFFRVVALCKNCSVKGDSAPSIFLDEVSKLTFMNSKVLPQYLNSTTNFAMYFEAGMDHIPFVLDAHSAHFQNYTEMVQAAGLL